MSPASCSTGWRADRGAIRTATTSRTAARSATVSLPVIAGQHITISVVFALVVAVAAWFLLRKTLTGFQIRVLGQAPRAGAFAGFSQNRMILLAFLISGGLAGLAGICEVAGPLGQLRISVSPGYGFTAIIVAFLGRLNPISIIFAGFVLALSYLGGEGVQIAYGVSEQIARVFQGLLLFFVLACDTLIFYRLRFTRRVPARAAARRSMLEIQGTILTIVIASMPLMFAALGELVTERSGVLNLGVEGMMAVGAVVGFIAGYATGMPVIGLIAAILAGMAMACLFALLTLVFVANQVASGLALTLFGLGLSALIGDRYVSVPGLGLPRVHIPFLTHRHSGRRADRLRRRPAGLCRHCAH